MSRDGAPDLVHGWKGIASVLGCSINTARRYAKHFELPVRSEGGRYVADRGELEAWKEVWDADPHDERRKAGGIAVRTSDHSGDAVIVLPRRTILWALSITGVIASAFGTWLGSGGHRDRPMESVSIERHRLTALDASSEALWSASIPTVDPSSYFAPIHYFFEDVDGDDRENLVFSVMPEDILNSNGVVVCWDRNGDELWRFEPGHTLNVGSRVFPRNFEAYRLGWLETSDASYVLVVAYHRPYYPTQLVLLEPTSGEVVGEYLHPGQISSYTLVNLDESPDLEILVGGINNPGPGPGRPVLVGLDLPFPADSTSYFGKPSARELVYLVFPRIDVVEGSNDMSAVRSLDLQSNGRLLAGVGTDESMLLYYHLNLDFDVLDLRPADRLVMLHDRLHSAGVIDHAYSREADHDAWAALRRFGTAPNANRLGDVDP